MCSYIPTGCNNYKMTIPIFDIHKLVISVAGVSLYGGLNAAFLLNISETSTLHHEYSSMACTVEIVDDVYAAVDHIHAHGRSIRVNLG